MLLCNLPNDTIETIIEFLYCIEQLVLCQTCKSLQLYSKFCYQTNDYIVCKFRYISGQKNINGDLSYEIICNIIKFIKNNMKCEFNMSDLTNSYKDVIKYLNTKEYKSCFNL